MKKIGLSVALCAALSFAVVTAMPTPVEAAKSGKSAKKSSKSSKSKAVKVTVQKRGASVSVTHMNNCTAAAATWVWPVAPVGIVGCTAVYAVPVIVETLFWRA